MVKDWVSKIRSWLEEGKDSSKNLVGLPWDIKEGEEEEFHYIYAQHPKIPFGITIYINPYFANLYIITNIETDAMDLKERMRIYKALLHMNSDSNLFKVGLIGNTDKVVVAVDLDLNSLNKAEFNDALSALVAGAYKVIEALDLEEEFEEQYFDRLAGMVFERLNSGETEADVKSFLVKRVGMKKDDAETLVNSIMEYLKEEAEKGEKPVNYIG